jgi:fluoroacetyl-CoA thioesterase
MLEPGHTATIEETVTDAMTADALGSGDVPVLGTPAVLALAEKAACAAIARELDDGKTSVGTWAELSHVAPTPVGERIIAEARLTEVDGRKLTFEFSVHDASVEIAFGTHGRVVVDRERFLRSVSGS